MLTNREKCAAAFATELKKSVAKAALESRYEPDFKEGTIMSYSSWVKEKLLSLINEMDRYHWLFTRNAEKDFSCIKKWSFGEIIKFIISMEGKSIKDELLEHFNFSTETPTNSSFNQRRAQILPDAFEFLFRELGHRDGLFCPGVLIRRITVSYNTCIHTRPRAARFRAAGAGFLHRAIMPERILSAALSVLPGRALFHGENPPEKHAFVTNMNAV